MHLLGEKECECWECPTSKESSAKKTTMNHALKGRKSVSVGSVCVLGEAWLELLADRLLLRDWNFAFKIFWGAFI